MLREVSLLELLPPRAGRSLQLNVADRVKNPTLVNLLREFRRLRLQVATRHVMTTRSRATRFITDRRFCRVGRVIAKHLALNGRVLDLVFAVSIANFLCSTCLVQPDACRLLQRIMGANSDAWDGPEHAAYRLLQRSSQPGTTFPLRPLLGLNSIEKADNPVQDPHTQSCQHLNAW